MKIITQLGILFAVCIGGSLIAGALPFPFPSSVAAMLILFVFLLCKLIKLHQIDTVGDFLQKNMLILFIPSGVGILKSSELMRGFWVQIIFICAITTVLTFIATAYTVRLVMWLQNGKNRGDKDAGAV